MIETEKLKNARNLLLKLHKSLVDFERASFTAFYGEVSASQFLSQLLENPDLAWLRRFSTLIVDIDEMFAQKDGFTEDSISAYLISMRKLILMEDMAPEFKSRYELALQGDRGAVSLQAELMRYLRK